MTLYSERLAWMDRQDFDAGEVEACHLLLDVIDDELGEARAEELDRDTD